MNVPEGVMEIVGDLSEVSLVQVAAILIGVWLLIVVSRLLLTWLANAFAGQRRHQVLATVPLMRLLVLVTAIVLLVPRIVDPSFENMVTILGAVGLAIGFAFKDYVSSLIAGIVTLYEMPYRLGDWIEVDGAYGEVRSIGTRATEIVTLDHRVVIIPHLKLWDTLIYNANDGTTNLMCVTEFTLHPQHDAARVRETLRRVALTSPFLALSHPISVSARERPWGTLYRVKAYPIDRRLQNRLTTDLTVRGKTALLDMGVVFAARPPRPAMTA